MVRIELEDGNVIRSDSRQYVVGKERTDKDGNVTVVNARYCNTLEHAMRCCLDLKLKSCNAKSFEELKEQMITTTDAICMAAAHVEGGE